MVSEHGSTLGLDGWCVGHAFMSISYVFSYPCCMWLMHPCCVDNGGSGVTMEVVMVLSSIFFHECIIDCELFSLMYCSCMLSYMFLHIVHEFLVYVGSHISHAFMLSMYACLCEVIC